MSIRLILNSAILCPPRHPPSTRVPKLRLVLLRSSTSLLQAVGTVVDREPGPVGFRANCVGDSSDVSRPLVSRRAGGRAPIARPPKLFFRTRPPAQSDAA